jgi:hypothetical protein
MFPVPSSNHPHRWCISMRGALGASLQPSPLYSISGHLSTCHVFGLGAIHTSVVCRTGVLVHMGWHILLLWCYWGRMGANVFFVSLLCLFAVTATSLCSASSHLCLVAICATADVHDVYELMSALSLIKVRKQTKSSVVLCDVC